MADPVKAGYWYSQSGSLVGSIDSSLFTHLFAAFANVHATSYQVSFPDHYERKFEEFTRLVQNGENGRDVKTILSIGGKDHDPSIFASMTSSPVSRQTFIRSSIDLARRNNYDGLSLNWQHPYTSEEMANLGSLLTEWRAAVIADSEKHPRSAPLLLIAEAFYSPDYPSSLKYPIQDLLAANLDWVNVMADDVYTPDCSPKLTGPPAPLYNPTNGQLSVDNGVRAWIHAGVPANKLVLCLPFHGRSWALVNANNNEILSPANGAVAGRDPIPYREIVTSTAVKQFDPSYVTDYCYSGTTWIGYDGKESISTKVRYAKKKGLRGYFAWHLDEDTADFNLSKEASEAWDNA